MQILSGFPVFGENSFGLVHRRRARSCIVRRPAPSMGAARSQSSWLGKLPSAKTARRKFGSLFRFFESSRNRHGSKSRSFSGTSTHSVSPRCVLPADRPRASPRTPTDLRFRSSIIRSRSPVSTYSSTVADAPSIGHTTAPPVQRLLILRKQSRAVCPKPAVLTKTRDCRHPSGRSLSPVNSHNHSTHASHAFPRASGNRWPGGDIEKR